MNKRYKLLSLLLCAGIVTSTFPSLGTGATSDSIAFYNSKKSILEMKEYDEAYDTNHDGVVNVFDVIRENKEVFQEESYTDLKAQIHSLETQIEILTQKLAEKEDKTQAESDLSGINSVLSGKVDQQEGKQLSSNDYTDSEKEKLANLNNYDDTSIKSDISGISSALSGKVDSQEGKRLSSNDYTDEEKIKLVSLENYDDTKLNEKIDSLVQTAYEEKKEIESSIENKVDKEEGKQLSSNDFTNENKEKLESLSNYDDSDIISEINDIKSNLNKLNTYDYSLSISKFNKNIVNHAILGYVRGNGYSGVKAIKAESGHFHISSPIFLEKGDEFVYGCTNYYGEVVTLAESDAEGNPIKFIRTGYNEKEEYIFVANKDMYVIMSYDDRNDYYGYIAENNSKYTNKTWCVFGDSLTEKNLRALMNYHDFVAQDLGINVINYGLSGSGYKNGGHWYTRIANITEDFDVCTLFGSFNDLGYEIGDVTDTCTETICGCINTTLDLFYTTYPNKKIGIITPTPWSVSYDNGSLLVTKSEQYVTALMTIAKMRGIPCLDLYHSSGLRPWDENFRYNYYREYDTNTGQYVQDEGTHPNSKGQEYFAYMVEEFIKSII